MYNFEEFLSLTAILTWMLQYYWTSAVNSTDWWVSGVDS